MKFSDYKRPCQNVGGVLKIWLQNSCDVSEDISQELTFVKESNFVVPEEFAEYQFTRTSARITEEEINNKNGRLVIYKVRFTLAKATIENEREINKLRKSDKIIVVLQDNNKQFRVLGSKCNPAEIKISYNSGAELGNENIYNVEITSAEIQKPYRLPLPTDPPYIPPPKSVIPIYLNIASRTLVFKANWDYLGQKIYRMYGGLTTDSFVFKVNPNPLAVDESHPSWAALPYLNHDDFIASTINQNYQIWIECVFIDLLVTEVLIETGKASINLNNAILIQQHYQTAASDIMLALPTVGSSSSNFSSAIAANIKYGRRENANFITGEDFTDFSNNLVDVNAALNFGDVAHVHFENTVPLTVPTHFKTININFGSGNYEVAQIETPLKKRYYPFPSNPLALQGYPTSVNLYVPNGATGSSLLWITGMLVGEERTYTWLGEPSTFGRYIASDGCYFRNLNNSAYFNFNTSGINGGYRFDTRQVGIQYCSFTIKRLALTGTWNQVWECKMFINGYNAPIIQTYGNVTNSTTSQSFLATLPFNFGLIGSLTGNIYQRKNGFFSMHKRILDFEEIEQVRLNLDIMANIPANYYYDLTNLQPRPGIPADRIIPNSGTDVIDDAVLEAHPTNTTVNLL